MSSTQTSTYVSGSLWGAGAALVLSGLICIGVANRKGLSASLIVIGVILVGVGVLVWWLYKPKPASAPSMAPAPATAPTPASSPTSLAVMSPKSFRWADESTASPQSPIPLSSSSPSSPQSPSSPSPPPLAMVRTFRAEEPPVLVQSAQTVAVPDHEPKPVPAMPLNPVLAQDMYQRRLQKQQAREAAAAAAAAEAASVPVSVPVPVVLGYESASQPRELPPMTAAQKEYEQLPTAGPVAYTPPSPYSNVNVMAEERQRFLSRPDTPAIDRSRRVKELQEAAMMLKPEPGMVAVR